MEQITIAGHSFNVPVRYEEGHELTAGEASALNQTYHENLRNNFAKKVKDAIEAAKAAGHTTLDASTLQAELDKYAEEYAFGVRASGGAVSRDPVQSEAMRIAKKMIGDMIRAKGGKVSDYEVSAINDAAKALLGKPQGEAIMATARQRVAEQQSLASENLGDLLSGLTQKPAEAPAAAPAPVAESHPSHPAHHQAAE